ncbi:DUF2515 family protein [Oceanobacillus halophilus]|uniref:DUF2515 domain-containing protein n=1 Tax=Oceanobacillus halophilus TaxID=930130 RepID=A0A495ACN9_9BACI|nr:DUF2515 family protein [Oceanobacillus halophilus]RKQ37632.1 DUF2515 domain-containing protein [Oceanobacillus halophilus]
MSNVQSYLYYISKVTKSKNMDNISRTKAYQKFYFRHPEIKWALLASVVSRNAGWNMTDLFIPSFQTVLGEKERMELFMTYERANWLIFSDAFPQLLIYQLSKQKRKPLFSLLSYFHVSSFMIKEWNHFWETYDEDRLMVALIINEQNVIHHPVIKQSYFKKQIFHKLPYLMQNYLFMSAVILPTRSARLYGVTVFQFTNLSKRIETGKRIANILFNNKIHPHILCFLQTVEHTGSRFDYEQFLRMSLPKSPMLRFVYPVVTHKDKIRNDWYKYRGVKSKWFQNNTKDKISHFGTSFYLKRHILKKYTSLKSRLFS